MPESIVFDTRYTFIGHGMNAEELARNPILDRWFVRDLNADPPSSTSPLAFEDESLDAVVCCCSVQYFQYPEMVFADLRRALKPGVLLLVSFTNKAFWTKALSVWGNSTEYARVQLVQRVVEKGQELHGRAPTLTLRVAGCPPRNTSSGMVSPTTSAPRLANSAS